MKLLYILQPRSVVTGIILQCANIWVCITKAHSAIIKRPRYLFPKLDVNGMSLIIDHGNGKAVRAGESGDKHKYRILLSLSNLFMKLTRNLVLDVYTHTQGLFFESNGDMESQRYLLGKLPPSST